MTRDQCLQAISDAFDGARTWSQPESYQFFVDAAPPRELIFSVNFFAMIEERKMTAADLTSLVRRIPADNWMDYEGSLSIVIDGFLARSLLGEH